MRLPFATATAFLAATAAANQAAEPEDNAIFEPSYNQAARSFDLDYDFNGYDGANNQRGRGIGSLFDILDFLTEGTTVPAKHIQNNQRGGGYGALFDILGYLAEGTTIPARRVQTNQRGGYEDYYDYENVYNQRGGRHRKGLKKWGNKFGNDLSNRLADTVAQAGVNAVVNSGNQQPVNNEGEQYVEDGQIYDEEYDDQQPEGANQRSSPRRKGTKSTKSGKYHKNRNGGRKSGPGFGDRVVDGLTQAGIDAATLAQAGVNIAINNANQQPQNNNGEQQVEDEASQEFEEDTNQGLEEEEDTMQVEENVKPRGGINKRSPAAFVAP
ncbi:hypothetical protein EC988_007542, partial [Linderina pennispora]